ncbi:MAG: hypothetical protein JW908_16945 [Anaerolineales bacterium]|nr:hypothetical protein [Anaerolineales bacterium]
MTYLLYSVAQKPESRTHIDNLSDEAWPTFLLHGDVHHWHLLFDMFPEYQQLLYDVSGTLMAVGHTVPFIWDGSIDSLPQTIEEIMLRGEEAFRQNQKPNTLSAVAAMVSSAHKGRGLSSSLIREMKALTRQHGCSSLIAPVRPTWKSRYPLTSMERYVTWTRRDGAPLDPWIRVHWCLGALPLCIAPNTLTVEGTIEEWETWTDMAFPESGSYIIPDALQPVLMDCEKNIGRYEDPNYWMKHTID